jgi:hypothetical protein
MDFFAPPTLWPNDGAVTDDEHPQDQLWSNRGAALGIERRWLCAQLSEV